jgi:cobalt-zinc-cadmium efflux system membrane fusion protein
LSAEGQIKFLRSTLGEETRTAVARIVLDNASGRWRPGMFVNGDITVDEFEIDILVERSAIITHDGTDVVFIQEDGRFVAQPVITDRSNDTHVEIVSGLIAGQIYVSQGAFTIKAELGKSELSDDD